MTREPQHLVVDTHTGSGKTTSVMKALDEIGARWIYAGPYHSVIDENIEDSDIRYYNFLHLKGRKERCVLDDVKSLAKAGIDISGFCESCPYKNTICKYHKDMRKAYNTRPNLAVTHAHIQHWLPQFLNAPAGDGLVNRDYYNVIIIDENPINCFIQSMSISRVELAYIHQCLILTGLHETNIHFKKFVDFVTLLMAQEIDYEAIDELNPSTIVEKRYLIIKDYSMKIGELLQQNIIRRPPTDIVNHLINLWQYRIGNEVDQMIYWRESFLNLSYFNRHALELGLGIIALDGTANRIVWEHMLRTDAFEIFEKDYLYVNAYQGKDWRYGIGSWLYYGDNTAKHLVKIIAGIAKTKQRNVLVVGTKRVNRKIRKFVLPHRTNNLEYATYYYLRSMNHYYKSCDTIILSCEPSPPKETIWSCVSLSGWDESVWRLIYTEEEMLQAIGRLRQNILELKDGTVREKMEIYIFPNTRVNITTSESTLLPDGSDVIVMKNTFMVDTAESRGVINSRVKILSALKTRKCGITSLRKLLSYSHNKAVQILTQMYNTQLINMEGRNYVITEKGLDELLQRS